MDISNEWMYRYYSSGYQLSIAKHRYIDISLPSPFTDVKAARSSIPVAGGSTRYCFSASCVCRTDCACVPTSITTAGFALFPRTRNATIVAALVYVSIRPWNRVR